MPGAKSHCHHQPGRKTKEKERVYCTGPRIRTGMLRASTHHTRTSVRVGNFNSCHQSVVVRTGCFSYSTTGFLQDPEPVFSVFHPAERLNITPRLPLLPFFRLAPLGEQLLHVTVGKREAQVPADRKQDHLRFKLAPLEQSGNRWDTEHRAS
jgi:hypothetical protein